MPLSGNELSGIIGCMNQAELFASLQVWAYRVGGYLVVNVLDDPAWLALMFC
jgi:hypothetical protein